MKLTKTTQDLTRFKPTKIDGIIDEFIAMECDKVKVENWDKDYASEASIAVVITSGLKRRKLSAYKAVVRNGDVYIAKTSEL